MAVYLGIDYGLKRCGIAITDALGMIATAHSAVETKQFDTLVPEIIRKEKVQTVVFGLPKRLHGEEGDITTEIRKKKTWLQQQFPEIKIDEYDERFTSKLAMNALHQMGATRKQKTEKSNVD